MILIFDLDQFLGDLPQLCFRPAEGPPRFEVPLNIPAGPKPTNQKYEVNFAQGDNTFGFQAMI